MKTIVKMSWYGSGNSNDKRKRLKKSLWGSNQYENNKVEICKYELNFMSVTQCHTFKISGSSDVEHKWSLDEYQQWWWKEDIVYVWCYMMHVHLYARVFSTWNELGL